MFWQSIVTQNQHTELSDHVKNTCKINNSSKTDVPNVPMIKWIQGQSSRPTSGSTLLHQSTSTMHLCEVRGSTLLHQSMHLCEVVGGVSQHQW
jgi:hypothetical protein